MSTILSALVSLFLLQPLQDSFAERLAAAGAPRAVVADVAVCATSGIPQAVERVTAEPLWALSRAIQVWVGVVSPEAALVEAVPGCARAVEAARPFLNSGAG